MSTQSEEEGGTSVKCVGGMVDKGVSLALCTQLLLEQLHCVHS